MVAFASISVAFISSWKQRRWRACKLAGLEEIPAIRDELLQELVSDNEKISDEEMNQFAMSRNTNTLFDILFQSKLLLL